MEKKVVEILYHNFRYGIRDMKVELECGHFQWFWEIEKEISLGDEVKCSKCSGTNPHKLEVLK